MKNNNYPYNNQKKKGIKTQSTCPYWSCLGKYNHIEQLTAFKSAGGCGSSSNTKIPVTEGRRVPNLREPKKDLAIQKLTDTMSNLMTKLIKALTLQLSANAEPSEREDAAHVKCIIGLS